MTWEEEDVYYNFLIWLEKISRMDEEDIHTKQFTTIEARNLYSAIMEDS